VGRPGGWHHIPHHTDSESQPFLKQHVPHAPALHPGPPIGDHHTETVSDPLEALLLQKKWA
jgi:hypothetical protein